MMAWLAWPLMCAINPTPQASCSLAGRYKPWAWGGQECVMGVSAKNVLKRCICCSAKNKIQRFFFFTQEIFAYTVNKIRYLILQSSTHPPKRGALLQVR